MKRWQGLLAATLLLGTCAAHAAAPHVLDDFSQLGAWHASGTDDIDTSLHVIQGKHGAGICLDFDFNGVSGAATLHRDLPIDFPEHFALSFDGPHANSTWRSSASMACHCSLGSYASCRYHHTLSPLASINFT